MNRALFQRTVLFLGGMGLCAGSLGTGLAWAMNGITTYSVVAALTSWLGYLTAHYAATGKFLDGIGTEEWDGKWMGRVSLLVGGGLGVVGIGIIASGLQDGGLVVPNIGAGVFLTGYVITHYGVTGELL